MKKLCKLRLFVTVAMGLAAAGVAAQSYPNKIIRVVNPAQPGGNKW